MRKNTLWEEQHSSSFARQQQPGSTNVRAWTRSQGFDTHQVLLDILICVHICIGCLEVSL